MKIIVISNMKGGVAKTTTTIMLAEAFAAYGNCRVLVIDLDTQCNASQLLMESERFDRIQEKNVQQNIKRYFSFLFSNGARETLEDFIQQGCGFIDFEAMGSKGTIDMVASSPGLLLAERDVLGGVVYHHNGFDTYRQLIADRVKSDMLALKDSYDYILIDTPPGISILTEAFIMKSDFVIIPAIPDHLSTYGLLKLRELFMRHNLTPHGDKERICILPTKYQWALPVQKKYRSRMKAGKYGPCFKQHISQRNTIAGTNSAQQTLMSMHQKYGSAAENEIRKLHQEILQNGYI